MFGFLKKMLGLPTKEEIAAAKELSAPYKVEAPIINNKTGDVVETPPKVVEAPVAATPSAVNDQITDAVTQVKKPRKPRTPKAKVEKAVKEKAAKPAKVAAKKVAVRRSKKA